MQCPWPPQGQWDAWRCHSSGGGGDAFQQSVRRQRGHAFTGEPRGNLAGHGLPQTFCVLAVACEALAVTFLFVEHFFFELGLSGDVG